MGHKYMKTTIDLPEDVMIRAKIYVAKKKMSLKELFLRGIEGEMKETGGAQEEGLIEALSVGRNTKPIGRLNREEIYDRSVFR
jgi:hypothetical protein